MIKRGGIMSLKSGSSDSENAFSGSLAESIDNAFKMEWLMAKGEPLPDAGADDRRLLFAALAQGLLNYLKNNDDDFKLLGSATSVIYIRSPSLTLRPKRGRSSKVTAKGQFFPSNGQITLIWDNPLKTYDLQADGEGNFEADFTPPAKAARGRHIVEARESTGHIAFSVFEKP